VVKGISRQVIVVHSPDPKLFEQAIFILKDDVVAQGVTDELLLKEAQQTIRVSCHTGKRRKLSMCGPVWAAGGAAFTGLAWLLTAML
jgi:hypothetical protein